MLTSLPNLLTLSRIGLIPVLLLLLYLNEPWARWTALALFTLAGVTDWLDGYLARRPVISTSLLKLSLCHAFSGLHALPPTMQAGLVLEDRTALGSRRKIGEDWGQMQVGKAQFIAR